MPLGIIKESLVLSLQAEQLIAFLSVLISSSVCVPAVQLSASLSPLRALPAAMVAACRWVLLLLTVLLIIQQSQCQETVDAETHQPTVFKRSRSLLQATVGCPSACDYRCSKADAQNRCLKFCNICCKKCNCVPPGTSGNKEKCPCYNQLKNSKGGPKCP